MRRFCAVLLVALVTAGPFAGPVAAASREQQQMMADIRMLQEQTQQLQSMLLTLTEALRTVTTRLDEQAGVNRKAFADQKLLVDTLAGDLRVVRGAAGRGHDCRRVARRPLHGLKDASGGPLQESLVSRRDGDAREVRRQGPRHHHLGRETADHGAEDASTGPERAHDTGEPVSPTPWPVARQKPRFFSCG